MVPYPSSYYEGTATSGYNNVEPNVRVYFDGFNHTVRVYVSNVYSGTTGTVTIPLGTHTTTTSAWVAKTPPMPPKNWRWFDGFRVYNPYRFNKCVVRYKPKIRVIKKSASKTQVAHHNRRMYVQDLRRV